MPNGASVKQIVHYSQEMVSDCFRPFDYGKVENLKKYGSSKPPNYDLSNIVVPVTLYYSDNDWLAAKVDVERFKDSITLTSCGESMHPS